MADIFEIFEFLNQKAPFELAESWDNCGILVEGKGGEVKKIITALDITCEVANEAVLKGADLVISHHPVIFRPLKALHRKNPAVILANAGIGAICMHTNFDIAPSGLNSFLCRRLGLKEMVGTPLDFDEGSPIGVIGEAEHELSCGELCKAVKKNLSCAVLRYYDSGKPITKVGICSGGGGSFLSGALRNGCDVLITGDVKHSEFIEAKNKDISLIDAGHYRTECIFSEWAGMTLSEGFKGIEVTRAESDTEPFMVLV